MFSWNELVCFRLLNKFKLMCRLLPFWDIDICLRSSTLNLLFQGTILSLSLIEIFYACLAKIKRCISLFWTISYPSCRLPPYRLYIDQKYHILFSSSLNLKLSRSPLQKIVLYMFGLNKLACFRLLNIFSLKCRQLTFCGYWYIVCFPSP